MKIEKILTIVFTAVVGVILFVWLGQNPVDDLTLLEPGDDNRPATLSKNTSFIQIGEYFNTYSDEPSTIPGEWLRFRGSDFDNIVENSVPLADEWPASGPPVLWDIDLGEGHAGAVVANGCVYVLDYLEEEKADALRCFSLETGEEIWRRWYENPLKRNHGLSRTVPAIQDSFIVTIGPECHVMCTTVDSGKFVWGLDLKSEYNAETPLWYTGQCALVHDSLAILATGGDALLVGIDLNTGEQVWRSENPGDWKMSHSSVIPMQFYGDTVFVYAAIGGLAGIAANGEQAGSVLFSTEEWNHNVVAPSPVKISENQIFITAGYAAGSMLLQVNKNADQWSIEPLQTLTPEQGIASEQQTPILYQNHLFSILPKDAGPNRNQFVCVSVDDLTSFTYTSGRDKRFGLGPYIVADGKIYILSDDGELTMIRLSTSEYEQLGFAKILDGHDAWGPFELVNGRLIARDSKRMVCVDLR